MTDKVIIYNRVSTTEQNPELQIKECVEFCKSKGWEIVGDPIQEQASAFKDESKREKFNQILKRAERREFNHIVVWNMDRFSRQPEEEVLKLVKKLNLLYGVDVNAVKGDLWSEVVQSISKIKEQGFIGEAISEFLEKIIRGLEFQRAYRESKTKSERVKLAVIKKEGQTTKSYKGKKWGRKAINSERLREKVKELNKQGLSIREITKHDDIYYYDRHKNKRKPSPATIHSYLKE